MSEAKKKFTQRKSEWKRRCQSYFLKANDLRVRAEAGEYVSQAEIYRLAFKLKELGNLSVDVGRECVRHKMRDHVLHEIQEIAHEVETHSEQLLAILHKRNYMVKNYPLFTTPMEYTTIRQDEPDPLDELNKIMVGQ